MARWRANVLAILLASFPSVVNAQVNCEAIPHGPARTDCYLGLTLQLPFPQVSESMGNHDSKIVDAGSVN
jgi:hypothetical protein